MWQEHRSRVVDRDTFDNTLKMYKARNPYRPFTVVMTSGDRLEVDFSQALSYREGVAAFIGPGAVPYVFDHEGVSYFIGDLAGTSSNAS
jgi:uncharacterized protein (DUF39 family)